jgi:hypothetical protein
MDSKSKQALSHKASIVGVVTDMQGTPLVGAVVMIGGESPEHHDIATVTDNQGRYRFDGLVPGYYTLTVNAEGYPLQTQQVNVSPTGETRSDFVLKK